MHERSEKYDPIEDWSLEARRRLVDERGHEIRFALDGALAAFVEAEPGVSLATFGFRGEDPIAEAVEWAVERFSTGDIDPLRLHPDSRSFRLFTEARFWLTQKVGLAGFKRMLAEARARARGTDDEARRLADDTFRGHDGERADAFARRLSDELRLLRARTCADLVGFWLEGTRRLRRDTFGWNEPAELSTEAASLSKRARSGYVHDAMFRFLCGFFGLLPAAPDVLEERAIEATCFCTCPNEPPYRRPDREALAELASLGVNGPREVGRARKAGAARFVRRCIDHALALGTLDPLVRALGRASLGRMTLHALGVEGEAALQEHLGAFLAATGEAAR